MNGVTFCLVGIPPEPEVSVGVEIADRGTQSDGFCSVIFYVNF